MSSRRFVFFFSSRRRHTRYYSDWSSDVCSSDLCRARCTTAGPRSGEGSPGALQVRRPVLPAVQVGQGVVVAGVDGLQLHLHLELLLLRRLAFPELVAELAVVGDVLPHHRVPTSTLSKRGAVDGDLKPTRRLPSALALREVAGVLHLKRPMGWAGVGIDHKPIISVNLPHRGIIGPGGGESL